MRTSSLLVAGPTCLLIATLLALQPQRAASQESVNPETTQKIDEIFADWDRTDSPGCALGVIQDGRFIYRRGYGMANLEHGVPIGSATVFYIASTSKQFVAASTLLAAEQGYLTLDDDVRVHVPELPDYGATITIRNLLHHTSGLRDYLTLWGLAGEEFADIHEPEEALALIARQKQLNFEPGAEYLYSNSGYFLLSVILERATGKTLKEFAHENIFVPLDMDHSHFHDDHTHISKNRAIGHTGRPDGDVAMYVSNFDLVGSGGLHTSVDDLLAWDRNFYANQLGEGSLLEELHHRGVLNDGDTLGYAAGLNIGEYKGLRMVRHGGSAQGYRTELLRFPDLRFSIICLCNLGSINPSGLANRVADVLLADRFVIAEDEPREKPKFITLNPQQLAEWEGVFRNPETATIWKITVEETGLQVEVTGNFDFRLSPLTADHFQTSDPSFHVDVRLERNPKRLHAEFDDGETARFMEVELVTPDAATLAEYAGAYYSDELEATWELELREGELFIIDRPDRPLAPTITDEFRVSNLVLEFERGSGGGVAGLVVDAGRVRNLRLERVFED